MKRPDLVAEMSHSDQFPSTVSNNHPSFNVTANNWVFDCLASTLSTLTVHSLTHTRGKGGSYTVESGARIAGCDIVGAARTTELAGVSLNFLYGAWENSAGFVEQRGALTSGHSAGRYCWRQGC